MELYLDDRKIDAEYFEKGTVEDALRHVQDEHCAPDRIVVALACDGNRLDSATMEKALARPILECDKLEVFTGTRTQLVIDAMQHCFDSLEQTERATESIADRLGGEQVCEALRELGECMKVWQQIHEALAKSIELLAIDPESFKVGDATLIEAFGRPRDVLLQIKEALQQQDHVLLADVLRYELSEATRTWLAIIDRIKADASRPCP